MEINIWFDAVITSMKLNTLKSKSLAIKELETKSSNTYIYHYLFAALGIACKNIVLNAGLNSLVKSIAPHLGVFIASRCYYTIPSPESIYTSTLSIFLVLTKISEIKMVLK
ncbi:MAG: hypothetical protein ACFB02_18835 [Mastigocoleus sp.]